MIEALHRLARLHLLAPVGGGEAGRHEVALQVHVDDQVPLVLGHRHEHAIAEDAGVVDEHVETTERGEGGVDQLPPTVPVGDVVVGRDRLPAGVADRGGRLLRHVTQVVHHDLRALLGEEQGVLASQTSSGAGDDGDAVLE